jgi:sortase B
MKKRTKCILAAASAVLLLEGTLLLFRDDATQKLSERRMEKFRPPANVTAALETLADMPEPTENTSASVPSDETISEENIPLPSVSDSLTSEMLRDFTAQVQAMQAVYPDAIGWLYLPDMAINYPIMQGSDNDFYLHHAPDGRSLKAGSVFLDCRCESRFMNGINIVYAHNMRNGSIFAGVTKYKNTAYFQNHRQGFLATRDTVYRIDFFSAAVVNRYDAVYDGSARTEDWLSHLKENSLLYENVDVSENDRYISLSTCSYEFTDARTVLTGKLVELEAVND